MLVKDYGFLDFRTKAVLSAFPCQDALKRQSVICLPFRFVFELLELSSF